MIGFLALLTCCLLAALMGLRPGGGKSSAGLLLAACLTATGLSLHFFVTGNSWSLSLRQGFFAAQPAFQMDAIAAFFLIPALALPALGAVYGLAYWPDGKAGAGRLRCLNALLAAALALLCLASQSLIFLFSWEAMALLAFFLILSENQPETRKASWVYLVATHLGTLCLFAAFALLQQLSHSHNFLALSPGMASSPEASAAFWLFLIGFGMKAGLFPLHFWLPAAHTHAPSHVSAVLSGILIKMGILGLLRFLMLVPDPPLWWGSVLCGVGAFSALFGVAMALGQHDLKRLLAYHSIENVGIIALGLGIGLLGKSLDNDILMLLGFAGGLLHVWNHGLFKALLFLAAGMVIQQTRTREIDRMGGLAKLLPWTAKGFLLGAWAICGLPPLNGFVSEWLLYLACIRGLGPGSWPISLVLMTVLALVGALAVACFVKAFAVIFLGTPRTPYPNPVPEASSSLAGMLPLALGCAVIGLLPMLFAPLLERVADACAPLRAMPRLSSFAHLPSLSFFAFAFLLPAFLLGIWLAKRGKPSAQKHLPSWDCGYLRNSPSMQYSASSFAETLLFGLKWLVWPKQSFLNPEEPQLQRTHFDLTPQPQLFPQRTRYHNQVFDLVLEKGLQPLFHWLSSQLQRLRILQAGHIPVYLLYMLLTILTLFLLQVL